jgi:hypothetical protein
MTSTTALAADLGAAVGLVQVLGVDSEDLGGARGSILAKPSERPLVEGGVLAGEKLLGVAVGKSSGAVRPRLAADELAGRVGGDPALTLPVGGGGADSVEADGGRRPGGPLLAEPCRERLGAAASAEALISGSGAPA